MKDQFKFFMKFVAILIIGFSSASCSTIELPNTSLDGVWSRGDIVITATGNNAVLTQINPNYRHLEAVNIGMISIGDQQIRNIRKTGNLVWAGEIGIIHYDTNSSGKITSYTGQSWADCIIVMSENGKTIQVTAEGYNPVNYTRVQ